MILTFCVASPRPMLTTIFSSAAPPSGSPGPAPSCSAGLISSLYLFAILLFQPSSSLCSLHGPGLGFARIPLRDRLIPFDSASSPWASGLVRTSCRRAPLCRLRSCDPHGWARSSGKPASRSRCAIGASCSAMPPLMFFCGFGRTFFFTMRTCSTSTRLPFPAVRAERGPACPLSVPGMTLTVVIALYVQSRHKISFS